uniref:Uncharacterized protein n=1 Tax=Anguilla anguilla TaxID=7936 RepID=A0A0E9SM81_ANGAN
MYPTYMHTHKHMHTQTEKHIQLQKINFYLLDMLISQFYPHTPSIDNQHNTHHQG